MDRSSKKDAACVSLLFARGIFLGSYYSTEYIFCQTAIIIGGVWAGDWRNRSFRVAIVYPQIDIGKCLSKVKGGTTNDDSSFLEVSEYEITFL